SVETFAIRSVGPDVSRSLSPDEESVQASLATAGEKGPSVGGVMVETRSREVTIDARVRTPDGAVSSRTMVVTLQRSVVTGPGRRREGRWIVTALRQIPASQTSRATSSVPQS